MSDPTDEATPDDIPPWHAYCGCAGCRAGNAAARRIGVGATPAEDDQ